MKTNYGGHAYGDLVISKALEQVGGGLSLEASKETIKDALVALGKQAKALAASEYEGIKPEVVAKTGAFTIKIVDEFYRLLEFSQGKADSRPEIALQQSMLERLTNEQLEMLKVWMENPHPGAPHDIV